MASGKLDSTWEDNDFILLQESATIGDSGTHYNMDLSKYHEFMIALKDNNYIWVTTRFMKNSSLIFRAMLDTSKIAQVQLDSGFGGFTLWRATDNVNLSVAFYAR
jgi:hypothetical protein